MSCIKILKLLFGILAAIFWFWSATINTPDRFAFSVVKPDMNPLGEPVGGEFIGHAYSPDLDKLTSKLREQSKLNRFAAFFTAITAEFTE
jgi:hypothetical protein